MYHPQHGYTLTDGLKQHTLIQRQGQGITWWLVTSTHNELIPPLGIEGHPHGVSLPCANTGRLPRPLRCPGTVL